MKSVLSLAALSAFVGSAVANDILVSRRMDLSKRQENNGDWNVTFFHINDVHAHLDEFSSSGSDCEEPEEGCYGGYARIKSKVTELKEEHPESFWLNAGDEFQGTLFYSFYKGEKIAEVMNDLDFDVMTLGNHEWDGGEKELGEYLANITDTPVVAANLKTENEEIKPYIKPYHIFEDKKLAVIGAITEETPSIADVGDKTEFSDPITAIQEAIYEIRNDTDVKYIVALTHVGYDVDKEIGEQTEGLSLIIGAHSHTLLGDMDDAEGKYPTVVNNTEGEEVFIVTSYRWGEYLGQINLLFDAEGSVLRYEGAPIHLTNDTAQDEELQEQIEEWRGPFEEFAAEVLGETDIELGQEDCQKGDCLLGQVMADAMLEYRTNLTEGTDNPTPDFALVNAGGIRATIDEGEITRGEVLTSFPFGNAIVEVQFTGEELRSILEGAVSLVNQENDEEIGSWFQVSKGVKIQYNPDNDAGNRLVNVTINDEPIDNEKDYRIVTLDFLAGGGDNIFLEQTDFATLDLQDEVLIQYIEAHSPLSPELEERVSTTDSQPSEDGSEGGEDGEDEGEGEGEGESEGDGDGDSAAGVLAAPFWTVLAVVGVVMATL